MEIAYGEIVRPSKGNLFLRQTVSPPNRLETSNWELLCSLASGSNSTALEALRSRLRILTGRQHIIFAPSCRSAIAQVLSLLPQREVVMPAYTCPVVKTAVEVAGKRIVFVDIGRDGVNATSKEYIEKARSDRVLLPTHLFGIPTDIEAICKFASERNCVTIEDAAAGFGATLNGRLLGTFADFGIFSFERSKRLPAFRGAAIVVNNETLINPAKLASSPCAVTEKRIPLRELALALFYNIATHPWLYGRLTLPHILRKYKHAQETPELDGSARAIETSFYTREFHPLQAGLVLHMMRRIDDIRRHISQLVSVYIDCFRNSSVATFISDRCDPSALLRFPIAFPGKDRAEILRLALRRGLYLETNYERPLPEPSAYSQFPNSVRAARDLVLLPLYTALSLEQARHIAVKVRDIGMESL